MYWQKRFDRGNPDQGLENKILEIREKNKDYGYRRMCGELHNQGYHVNKKKCSGLCRNGNFRSLPLQERSVNTVPIKAGLGQLHLTG